VADTVGAVGIATTTIDLGELPQEEPTETEPARPARLRRQTRRAWLAAAATALVVLATGAAAAAPSAWATHHFTVRATDFFELTDEMLYVIDASDPARPAVIAYRLDDGSRAWDAHSPSVTEQYTVVSGIPLFVQSRVVELDGTSWHVYESTSVLDPETGVERWTRDGFPAGLLAGDLLVMEHRPTGPEAGTISVVELPTGRELWRLPAEARIATDWSPPAHAEHVVALADDRLTTHDLRTGAALATATVVTGAEIAVVGPVVLVSEVERAAVTAYDLLTLQRRWSIPAPDRPLIVCGALLCGFQADELYAVDPVTGERAWSAAWLQTENGAGPFQPPAPWPAGLLLAGGWVVDAATGEAVLELTDWEAAYDAWWGAPVPQPALVRYQPGTDGGLGTTWFGRPRADPPGVEVLGAVTGAPNDCLLNAEYLVCRKATELHVWRIRR
jgi:hypothetical protein